MKKIAVVLLAMLTVLLSGCSAKTPPDPVLDFTADMYVDGAEYLDGVFDIYGEIATAPVGMTTITVTTPDELWGLRYKWSDGFELSFNGLHLKTEKGYLPSDSFAEAIYSVLTSMARESVCESYEGGVATFCGESQSGEYTATTDKSGYIQNISIEEINLSVNFTYE